MKIKKIYFLFRAKNTAIKIGTLSNMCSVEKHRCVAWTHIDAPFYSRLMNFVSPVVFTIVKLFILIKGLCMDGYWFVILMPIQYTFSINLLSLSFN